MQFRFIFRVHHNPTTSLTANYSTETRPMARGSTTKAFARLQEYPRTSSEVDVWHLKAAERMMVQRIVVTGLSNTIDIPSFISILYIEGDEQRAVARFIEENEDALAHIDFTTPNRRRGLFRKRVSPEIYELVLEQLGHRKVRTYANVVVEDRPDETVWIYDRGFYAGIDRRYRINSGGIARLPTGESLDDLYEQLKPTIRKRDLQDYGVEGTLKLVFRFYLDCGLYDCELDTPTVLRCKD